MGGAGEEYPEGMEKNQRQEEVGAQGKPQYPVSVLAHFIFQGDAYMTIRPFFSKKSPQKSVQLRLDSKNQPGRLFPGNSRAYRSIQDLPCPAV